MHLFSQARGTLRYDEGTRELRAARVADANRAGRRRRRLLRPSALQWPMERGAGAAAARARGAPRRSSSPAPVPRRATSRSRRCGRSRRAARRQALRRSAERRHRQRHRARRARGLPGGRAPEALYDARHGHRPGQDQQRHRPRADGGATGHADPARRHDDLSSAVYAGHAGRDSGRTHAVRTSSRRGTRRCTPGTRSTAHASSMRACGSGRIRTRAPANPRTTPSNREARNVRSNVGVVDVSTLGKIELQGRDVAEFLNRIYINRWDTLAVGRCRYGVMLRDDGMVLDDGTTSRLDATHYLMTTTTVNAVRVMQHIESLLQVDWPELDVYATSVTEQWAAAAVSGPRSREVLAALVDIDVSNAAFPFLAVGTCHVRARRRNDSRAPVPDELLGRTRVRDPCAGRSRARDVGGGHRCRRGRSASCPTARRR